jgi:glucosamine 6-phosphate synthetase-like amidotransferase/phosphosugar isomerase protein
MQKEIFEQPQAIRDTLSHELQKIQVVKSAFGIMQKKFLIKLNKYKLLLVELAIMQD